MSKPLVSVVIPTHNRAHLLGRAISTVLEQTVQDFELIVVDDCSSDDTEAVVADIGDSRIRYLRHDQNKGGSAARNTGIDASTAPYVAFLDSDDEWLPEKLERQLEVFSEDGNGSLGLVYCRLAVVRDGVVEVGEEPALRGRMHRQILMFQYGPPTSTYCVSREVFDRGIRFDSTFPAFQDWDFLLQVSRQFDVDAANEALVRQHRMADEPRVWSGRNVVRALELITSKYGDELDADPSLCMEFSKKASAFSYAAGDMGAARAYALRGMKAQPFAVSIYPWIMASTLGRRPFAGFLRARKAMKKPRQRPQSAAASPRTNV